MQAKTERFEMRLDQSVLEKIDGWRSSQDGFFSRAEAIRRLVDEALETSTDEMAFCSMRFQVLSFALTRMGQRKLSDAYVFAWDEALYPLSENSAEWHKPFKQYFRVTEEMMEELSKFLDDRWRAKKVPTFYELEDRYEVRSGGSEWDRYTLIAACRYFFLNDLFDEGFWKKLIKPMEHPSEAASVVKKFDRYDDVYFV